VYEDHGRRSAAEEDVIGKLSILPWTVVSNRPWTESMGKVEPCSCTLFCCYLPSDLGEEDQSSYKSNNGTTLEGIFSFGPIFLDPKFNTNSDIVTS
jgi:hypothetical protein